MIDIAQTVEIAGLGIRITEFSCTERLSKPIEKGETAVGYQSPI
jgi:hypothetical protein